MQLTAPDYGVIGTVRLPGDTTDATMIRSGFLDVDPGDLGLTVRSFPDVPTAARTASELTTGAHQAAVAVVELDPGEFTIQHVEARHPGAMRGTPIDLESDVPGQPWVFPTVTDPLVKALVDGPVVMRTGA